MRLIKALAAIPCVWIASIVLATFGAYWIAKECWTRNEWPTEMRI